MKTRFHTRRSRSVTVLCSAAALALGACASERPPTPAEWRPLESARPAREPLPDEAERIAARLAAAALVGRYSDAQAQTAALAREDAAREERGELPSGLSDNAAELLAACGGSESFPERADALLARDDLDPAMRRRLELARDRAPLAIAATRIGEERRFEAGALFNRLIEPLSTLAFSGVLNPIAASRSALSALLAAHQIPASSPRERQALHAWDDWLERHPDSPEAPEIAARASGLRAKLAQVRAQEDLRTANAAADHGAWEVAQTFASRAQRQVPDDPTAAELLERAARGMREQDARTRSSLSVRSLSPESLEGEQTAAFARLARTAIAAPLGEVAPAAREFAAGGAPPEMGPELRLLASFEPLAAGDEDGVTAALERVPETRGASDTASRQAGALLADPSRSAWLHYQTAVSADDRARLGWIAVGRFANGAQHRNLWRPIEYLVDLPGLAMAIGTFPLRIAQYPSARSQFGNGVLLAGERYTARYPDGPHAEEVNRELESLYALHGQPSAALRHAQARREPDPKKIAEYRAQVAAQLLAAADKQTRMDVHMGYLAAVAREYPDTPSAAEARKKFAEEKAAASPQRIRLTREFLLEHPSLWAPGALGLRPELLDGKRANGEIAETGVTLLGKNVVEISLEDREPVRSLVPAEDFARFVAQLEETSHTSLARDDREKAVPDAARDAFFASSRLGVIASDSRPAARSDAVFESTEEKHGSVRSRDSILPVELVLHGDLETLGLSAFPRIRLPEASPDTLFYQ
jgi:hypothetical protein